MYKWISGLFFVSLMSISYLSFNNSSGPGGGYTNAPSESNCTSCHGGNSLITSGTNWSNIRFSGDFFGGGYVPDSTYRITLTHKHSGISKFGFQITALDDDDDPAGTLGTGSSGRVRVRTRNYSGKTRYYIEHTNSGTSRVAVDSAAWTFEWTAPSANVGDVTFYSVVNSTNSNSMTSGDLIFAKTFKVSPSDSLPDATASADTTTTCQRSSIRYRGSGNKGTTDYSWTFTGGSPSTSNLQNPQVTYNAPGNYLAILRVKNKYGFSQADTLRIRVNASPNAFISGSNDRTKCTEDAETLIADFVSGATYRWSNGARTRDITVTDSGRYQVEVTANGCSNISNEVSIKNHPRQSMNMTTTLSGDSICQGGLMQLTASSGFNSYKFFDSSNLFLDTTANVIRLNVNKRSLFYVLGLDQNGCDSDTSNKKLVKISPQIDTPRVQCVNKDPFFIEFSWSVFDHYNSFEVSLDSGRSWITPSSGAQGNTHRATGLFPATDYLFMVRGKGNGPCLYSPVGRVVCSTGQCNGLNVSVSADSAVCKGEDARVEINGLSGERYSIAFENLGFFTDTIIFFTPQLSKQYLVEVYDSNSSGCPPSRLFFDLKLDELGEIELEPSGRNSRFCEGEEVVFRADSGASRYDFLLNEQLIQSGSSNEYRTSTIQSTDSLYAIAFEGKCQDTTSIVQVVVTPLPSAGFSWERNERLYTFTPERSGLSVYRWDFGNGQVLSEESPVVDLSDKGGTTIEVELTVTDVSNCTNTSTQQIDIPDFASTSALMSSADLLIFPNPVDQYLSIEGIENRMSWRMYHVNGQLVEHGELYTSSAQIDVTDYPSGVYILRLFDEEAGKNYAYRINVSK